MMTWDREGGGGMGRKKRWIHRGKW